MKINWYQEIYGEDEPEPGMGLKWYILSTEDKDYDFQNLADAIEWMLLNPSEPCTIWNFNTVKELLLERK